VFENTTEDYCNAPRPYLHRSDITK